MSVDQISVTETLSNVDALTLQYPSTVYDCETLLLDPSTADLYLITKDVSNSGDNGTSYLFRSPALHDAGAPQTLMQVGSLDLGSGIFNRATGGDISPDGRTILLRSYSTLRSWARGCNISIAKAIAQPPCMLPLNIEIQGESIAFAGDGAGYYTTSERAGGVPQPIYFYESPTMVKGECRKPSWPLWSLVVLLTVVSLSVWFVNR